jgi:hypothetical protein
MRADFVGSVPSYIANDRITDFTNTYCGDRNTAVQNRLLSIIGELKTKALGAGKSDLQREVSIFAPAACPNHPRAKVSC